MKMFFKRSPTLSVENVRDVLQTVADPVSGQDIVRAGLVSGLAVREGKVGFVITVPYAEKDRYVALPERCREMVMTLRGAVSVTPVLTAETLPTPEAPPRARAQWNLSPVEGVRRIIAVASGKGGVGKSTATVNLALALAADGKRVGILDADIYGPSIPRMLGQGSGNKKGGQQADRANSPRSGVSSDEQGTSAKLMDRRGNEQINKLIPVQAHGISCMSMGFLLGDSAAIMRGPMVTKSLVQMLRGTLWGTEAEPLDVLLVDLPPGTGDVHLSMVQQVPLALGGGGAVIVTTPQEVALDDARKAASMFVKVDVPILGVIENMSYFTDPAGTIHHLFGEGGGGKLAKELGVPLLGEVPLLPEIGRAGECGVSADTPYFAAIARKL